ncbi:hypothetical protein XENTR_v10022668 [Xenopus tropicalis]|nr:hypothetical protein XENTR_v10022668 [Xenopus tropicalis]
MAEREAVYHIAANISIEQQAGPDGDISQQPEALATATVSPLEQEKAGSDGNNMEQSCKGKAAVTEQQEEQQKGKKKRTKAATKASSKKTTKDSAADSSYSSAIPNPAVSNGVSVHDCSEGISEQQPEGLAEIYFYYAFGNGYRTYKDEQYISVSELFSVPQIKVRPDQVIRGDHMTITCDTELSPHRETTELQFAFYRNGHNVQGFSLSNQYGVPSAQLEDSGKYTCEVQTPTGSVRKRSREAHIHIQELLFYSRIKVSSDQVREGDHMTITCDTELRPHRETTELQFAFYRNGHNVQGFSSSNQYGVPSAQLEDSGNYTCEVQTPTGSVRKRSREAHMHIQELFTNPQIKVSPDQVTEGDNMTITCDTELSPHRETTELQFAFYRNGHNVQGFSLSNQYGVPSAQLEDSGNYTCEVQTPTGSVRKRSNMAHIHIQGNPQFFPQLNLLRLILSFFLFIWAVCLICHHVTANGNKGDLVREREINLRL